MEPSARKVSKLFLISGDPCKAGTISYAWISPQGRVFEMKGSEEHYDWASDHLEEYGLEGEEGEPGNRRDPREIFVEAGWLKLSNIFALDFSRKTPQKAWDAWLEMAYDCLRGERAPQAFLSRHVYYYEYEVGGGGRGRDKPLSEFIRHKFGRAAEDKLFEIALESTPSRNQWQESPRGGVRWARDPCSPIMVSYAWVSPKGEVFEVPNETEGHSGWATKNLERFGFDTPPLIPGEEPSSWDALLVFSRAGWLKVSNIFAVEYSRAITQKAWDAWLEMVYDCLEKSEYPSALLKRNVFAFHEDGSDREHLDRFVSKKFGRRAEDRLFEIALAKTAPLSSFRSPSPQRIARRYFDYSSGRAGDPK